MDDTKRERRTGGANNRGVKLKIFNVTFIQIEKSHKMYYFSYVTVTKAVGKHGGKETNPKF